MQLMTTEEVLEMLGINLYTLRKLEGRGVIKPVDLPPKYGRLYDPYAIRKFKRALKNDDDTGFTREEFELLQGKWYV